MNPSSWLPLNRDLLPTGGLALDLACGRGRHALWLAAAGFAVEAMDRDREAIEAVNAEALSLSLPVLAQVRDLEAPGASLGAERYDVIIAVHYLHRPLFPAIIEALRPGGLLLYETFTREQAARGKPTNPDFLLLPGELLELTHTLDVLRSREGDFEGRMIASVAARKPSGG